MKDEKCSPDIGIYGLGRFGSFWGEILSSRYNVKGYSRHVKDNISSGIKVVSEDELLNCDVIILCVSISSVEEVSVRIAGKIKPGAIVMDTCSVKVHPLKILKKILPESVDIIGTHPMFGPDSARNGIEGLPIVYSPLRIPDTGADFWRNEFLSMGMNVIDMTPEEHDREAAYTQGITHLIGRVLNGMELSESRIATLGYKRLLGIIEQTCNDPWQLFLDLQRYNPYTEKMRAQLKESLEKTFSSLE